jgi:7,8-dihydroneopterin aldolase/epimerase/oxygenase
VRLSVHRPTNVAAATASAWRTGATSCTRNTLAPRSNANTLERLCSTIADRLLADYELEGVWVKATKPEPPIALTVDEVSVEVWREAEG